MGMMGMPGGKPGMPPMYPGQPGMPGMPGMPQPGARPPAPAPQATAPLSASALAAATPAQQKQMLGEKLFPAVSKYQPQSAGKITGMMLEMDNSELLILLESPEQLKNKVDEAIRVLDAKAK